MTSAGLSYNPVFAPFLTWIIGNGRFFFSGKVYCNGYTF